MGNQVGTFVLPHRTPLHPTAPRFDYGTYRYIASLHRGTGMRSSRSCRALLWLASLFLVCYFCTFVLLYCICPATLVYDHIDADHCAPRTAREADCYYQGPFTDAGDEVFPSRTGWKTASATGTGAAKVSLVDGTACPWLKTFSATTR